MLARGDTLIFARWWVHSGHFQNYRRSAGCPVTENLTSERMSGFDGQDRASERLPYERHSGTSVGRAGLSAIGFAIRLAEVYKCRGGMFASRLARSRKANSRNRPDMFIFLHGASAAEQLSSDIAIRHLVLVIASIDVYIRFVRRRPWQRFLN